MNWPRPMQAERAVLALAVFAGLVVGLVDAVLDYWLFYDGTFLELLITNVPKHEIYIRSVILASFVVFGLIASRSLARQRRAENALRESQRTMGTLLSNLPGMAYRCLNDRDWTMLFLSDGTKGLTGYDPSELLDNKKKSYAAIIRQDDRDAVWSEVQEALASDRPFAVTYRIVPKEGKEKWVWEQGRLVAKTDDDTGILEGFITDITERKLAERALRESEEKFRLLVENQSDMLVKLDNDGRLLFVSPSYCRAFGTSEQELVGSTFMPLIHEDDREAVARAIKSVYQPPHDSYVEERALTVEGWRWQAWVNTAVLNDQNEVIGIVASGRDITERKRAETGVIEKGHLLSESQQLAHVGGWQCELASGNITWTDETYRIYGVSPDTFVLTMESFLGLIHLDDRAAMQEWIRACSAGEKPGELEFRTILPDGDVRVLVGDGDVICDADNRPVRVVGAVQDITERKRTERALQEMAETLEHRVQERTAELKERNAELDAFAHSVSHDLRAPLRAIEGFSRALLEDYGPQMEGEGHDFLEYIADSAVQMDGLIKDLLAYSRIGRTELRLQAVSFEGVVAEAKGQLQASIDSSNAEVIVDGQLPSVRAHFATLRQVVANLLSNALKFASLDVRPEIRIWAELRQGMVRLWVQDNGIGIDEEYQTRIFQAFERLHGIERYPGTGIGLAIVQRATERMGGRCGVESTLGQGSRFWVEYPQYIEEQEATWTNRCEY